TPGSAAASLVATDSAGKQAAEIEGTGLSPYSLVVSPMEAVVGKLVAVSMGSPTVGSVTVQSTPSGTPSPTWAQVSWGDGSVSGLNGVPAATIQPGPVTATHSLFYVQADY